MIVFGYLILINIDLYDFISPFFSLVLVLIEKIYLTLKTAFDHNTKHLQIKGAQSRYFELFEALKKLPLN